MEILSWVYTLFTALKHRFDFAVEVGVVGTISTNLYTSKMVFYTILFLQIRKSTAKILRWQMCHLYKLQIIH
jgi:hypothetical protein